MKVTILRSLLICLLLVGFMGVNFQEIQALEKEREPVVEYYYADGKKIPLEVAPEYLAVRLKTEADTQKFTVQQEKAKGGQTWQQTAQFPKYHIVLLKTGEPISITSMTQFKSMVMRQPEVETVTPVYRVGEEKYLVIPTDEFFARFRPEVSIMEIEKFNKANAVEIVEKDRYEDNLFILRVLPDSTRSALEMANFYHENSDIILWASPNFLIEVRKLAAPNDTYFPDQWHLDNTGQAGGTSGEDVDAVNAWDMSLGNGTIVIAIIDDGVDYNHQDLQQNIFENPWEIPNDNIDNDNNNFIDDVRGWDFFDDDNNPIPSTFNFPFDDVSVNDIHGTPCAGVAAARIGNALGVTGIAGNCKILPIKIFGGTTASIFTSVEDIARAIYYASDIADVLSNSWTTSIHQKITDAFTYAADYGRNGKGCVILCSSGNGFSSSVSYPAELNTVLAVGASTNNGVRSSYSNYGSDLDIVAPSNGGTAGIYTTDVSIQGRGFDDLDNQGFYTRSFGGTSSSTPLAAGIAALVLSMDPTLAKGWVEVILETTAEKIDSANANYNALGFSNQYGYGRVNASLAMEKAKEYRLIGVDVYSRDNTTDNGDTPSVGYWYVSPDIKVDAPFFQSTSNFDLIQHEKATGGEVNKVYVRVHNRGAAAAGTVTVNLYWAYAGMGLPLLPEQFWAQYPGPPTDQTDWHYIGQKTITNLTTNIPQYVVFDWTTPTVDPTKLDPEHYSLIAIIDCTQDPVFVKQRDIGIIVPNDNNITSKNVAVENPKPNSKFDMIVYMGNPKWDEIRARIRLLHGDARELGWTIKLGGGITEDTLITLKPLEQRPVTINVTAPADISTEVKTTQEVNVHIIQERMDRGTPELMGGVDLCLKPVKSSVPGNFSLSIHGGVTFPITDFGSRYNSSYMFAVDMDYHFNPRLSAVALIGFNHFRAKPAIIAFVGSTYWWNLSANLKWEFTTTSIKPYVNGGFGLYIPKTGSTKPGYNLGVGLNRSLNPNLAAEVGVDYHHILTTLEDPEFFTAHAGLIFRF